MQLSFKKLLLLISIASLSACSNNTNSDKSYTLEATGVGNSVFPLATPIKVSYQDEVKLLRINQLINDQENVDNKQRAILFYERGLIYDRIGMSANSRYDFTQAINLDPTFAEPYNFLGVYQLMGGDFDEAFDSFDSAIELSELQYGYLHRAVGLTLVERYDGAQSDIERFYSLDKSDAYRILWRYIVNVQIDPKLAVEQLQNVEHPDKPEPKMQLAWRIIDVMNGDITEEEFFDNITAGVKNNDELAQRLCESYYYLAHWHINNNNLNKGIYYLKLSLASNVKDFIEYKYALIDLSMIQQKVMLEALKEKEALEK